MERWSAGAHAKFGLGLAATLALAGCGWPGLIAGALSTPTSVDDASTNVAIADGVAYVARSARGIERIELASGRRATTPPPAPVDRIDDLAVADGLVFALDATPPGHLLTYRVGRDGSLHPVARVDVAVGPFSGVAAADGHVIVSGGTSALSLHRYRSNGQLETNPSFADFGRGQPDIALADGGRVALVSTHVQGPRFGLTVADIVDAPLALRERGYVELPGAGFTAGGFHPANFALQAAAYGDYVLVAHGGGLSVLAAPVGRAPSLAAWADLGLQATAIAVDAARAQAFVTGASPRPQLLTLNIADPRHPRVLARESLMAYGSPSAIALDASHLVVALQGGGVHLRARPAPSLAASPVAPTSLETAP